MNSTIKLGELLTGRSGVLKLDLKSLLSTRMLVQAASGGGKSRTLRRIIEQAFGKIQIIVVDPEGEFSTLREKYDFLLVAKEGDIIPDVRSAGLLATRLLETKASCVCDIYELKVSDRHLWVKNFLHALINAPKNLRHPVLVVVDEAHKFCPEKGAGESVAAPEMVDLASLGRKRGLIPIFATQRLAKLQKDVSAELQNRLVGRTFEDVDVDRALKLFGLSGEAAAEFSRKIKTMEPGKFFALGSAMDTLTMKLVFIGDVETSHPEIGKQKFKEVVPPAPKKIKAMLDQFRDLPQEAEEKVRSEQELKTEIRDLKGQLKAAKAEVKPAERIEVPVLSDKQVNEFHKSVGVIGSAVDKLSSVVARIHETITRAKNSPGRPIQEPTKLKIQLPKMPVPLPSYPKNPLLAAPYGKKAESKAASDSGDTTISSGMRNILNGLAELDAMGRKIVPRTMLAVMCGVSAKSSGYVNNLSSLNVAGLIRYEKGSTVVITEAGLAQIGAIDPPETNEELADRVNKILNSSQRNILAIVRSAYPSYMQRTVIAEAINVSAKSSGYVNNLSFMNVAGIIEYGPNSTVKAADWLFIE